MFQVKYSHIQNIGQRPVVTMALRYLEDCSKKRLFLHFSMAFVDSLSPGRYLVKSYSNHTTVFSSQPPPPLPFLTGQVK